MSEIDSDDPRFRAAEQQMRHALGLRQETSSRRLASNSPHPHRRPFARDGDVPVEVLHGHDNGSGINQLDATRKALQAQIASREEAERLLAEARHTIHDFQTKLGHERLAREEAARHAEAAKREVELELSATMQELEAEHALRMTMAKERDQAIVGRQSAEDRLRQARSVEVLAKTEAPAAALQPRRRGRPPKVKRDDTGFVEWWAPGWKSKYR
jgi:hypothetical protein